MGQVPSVLLGREIYITASVLGACTYVGASRLGVDRQAAMVTGFLVGFAVRGLAMRYGLGVAGLRPVGGVGAVDERGARVARSVWPQGAASAPSQRQL